ncbi:MAG TPA: hypothetical protein VFU86_16155 [Terriglobales bacterium]|nr:hypothetical protein [Terriglobales bacterium]
MRLDRNFILAVVLLALSTGVACHRKKPNIPAKAQPPAIEQPTIPPVANQPAPTPPTVTPGEEQPAPTEPAPVKAKKPKRHRRTVPATNNAANTPSKPAPKPESTPPDSNVQITAEIPQNVANERRQQTEGLLQTAEANLKKINRTLTDGEESMQRQVRNYITQSRLAMQDGDLDRAYQLANKAQLLSQELVK